jgi:hypothetical protein
MTRELTGKVWNRKTPMAQGQTQQTAPATANAMAMILITTLHIPYSPHRLGNRRWAKGSIRHRVGLYFR